ncbi:MAG: ABC transporter ATP-binding protein [Desulfovibrionales bacterium]
MVSRHDFLLVSNLKKTYSLNGNSRTVLNKVSLSITKGSIMGLIGRSGCGKTTVLNTIAGFLHPDEGDVRIDGRMISGPGPDRGVVFQENALFPWLTVEENIAAGLKRAVKQRKERDRRIDQILELVGLKPFARYLPRELSGGMKQRVALARVLVLRPRILLMDEPFAGLDAQTREEMHALLLELQKLIGQTILFVSHDVEEVLVLSDDILALTPDRAGGTRFFSVPLPRPRLPDHPDFLHLKKEIRECLASFDPL